MRLCYFGSSVSHVFTSAFGWPPNTRITFDVLAYKLMADWLVDVGNAC
jgi:hypothetical protein